MHRVRCLGRTLKDTSKEAKLHGRQCPLHASFRFKFPRLLPDASHVRREGGALGDRALPVPCAGNLFAAEEIRPRQRQYYSK